MDRVFRPIQSMDQESAWGAASVLHRTSAELERNAVFRALVNELASGLSTRSSEDQALVILLPGVLPCVQAHYAGKGPPLHELIDPPSIQVVDTWLAGEIRYWAGRWLVLDPTRNGLAPSTRAALESLVLELHTRIVPKAVAFALARLACARSKEK